MQVCSFSLGENAIGVFQLQPSFSSAWLDVAGFMRVPIYASDFPALILGINVFESAGSSNIQNPSPLCSHCALVLPGILRLSYERTVVLQPAIHLVRILIVHADVIKLRDRNFCDHLLSAVTGSTIRRRLQRTPPGNWLDRSTRRGSRHVRLEPPTTAKLLPASSLTINAPSVLNRRSEFSDP